MLALVTAVNLRGIAHSARLFVTPTVIFVLAILGMVVAGLLRDHPVSAEHAVAGAHATETVGVLLLLRAFASGCAALTGVEAIANAVPSFRRPRVTRAQRAEVALGALLGVMLIGVAAVIVRFHIRPVAGVTVLSQVAAGSLGHGLGYYVVQFSTVVLLALAANTSFGGMPVLARLLARDNNLPHVFALRAEHQVHRYGICFLAVTGALLLIGTDGDMNMLVPLFAIGVFVCFTLSQAGMVRHWWQGRPPGWRTRVALNGFGALLTGLAAVIVTVTKFPEGGWLIVVATPAIAATMAAINRAYRRIGERLELDRVPGRPRPRRSLVIVPIGGVNRLTKEAISAALSLGDRVVALRITHTDEPEETGEFIRAWESWAPDVNLALVSDDRRRLVEPIVEYVRGVHEPHVFVLIPEVEPAHVWQRVLQNQRGAVLAHALRRDTDVVVCRLRFRLARRIT